MAQSLNLMEKNLSNIVTFPTCGRQNQRFEPSPSKPEIDAVALGTWWNFPLWGIKFFLFLLFLFCNCI